MTRLEAFRRLSELTYERLGHRLGRTGVQTQRYCKPATDARHSQPGPLVGIKMKEITHAVIDLGNYAEEVSPVEAAEMMAEISRRAAAAGEAAHG